jgi:hypothetical protein
MPSRTSGPLATLLAAFAIGAFLAMMFVHELGHVVAATLTGARVVSLELSPGALSHTLVQPNPSPSVVLGGGFVFGSLAPLMTAPAWRAGRTGRLAEAWAAFCVLANGSYLAVGGGERLSDTGLLVRQDWPLAMLVVIGVALAGAGYLWSRGVWRCIADDVSKRPVAWREALAWVAWVAVWVAVQEGVARWIEPQGNVR